MKKLTKWWILSIACLAISGVAMGCSDENDNNNNTGGTGGTAGQGGSGGHAGHAGSGGSGGHAGTGGSGGSAGSGGSGGSIIAPVTIAGHLVANPLAVGATPDVEGLTVNIIDPAKRLADPTDPTALLGTGTTDADGKYTITNVDLSGVGIGAVVTVEGKNDVATSTMGLCNNTPALPCEAKTDFTTFVVPTSLVNLLQNNLAKPNLFAEGFVLGLITEGVQPLAGASAGTGLGTVTYLNPTLHASSDDFTSAAGAFVAQPAGVATAVPDKDGFTFIPSSQNVGKTANVVFQVFFVGSPTP